MEKLSLKKVIKSNELTKEQKLKYIEMREKERREEDIALECALIKARAIVEGKKNP